MAAHCRSKPSYTLIGKFEMNCSLQILWFAKFDLDVIKICNFQSFILNPQRFCSPHGNNYLPWTDNVICLWSNTTNSSLDSHNNCWWGAHILTKLAINIPCQHELHHDNQTTIYNYPFTATTNPLTGLSISPSLSFKNWTTLDASLTLCILKSVCLFSILLFTHFLRCW